MKHQVVSFTLMIFLTLIAFAAVAIEGFSALVHRSIYFAAGSRTSGFPIVLFYAYEAQRAWYYCIVFILWPCSRLNNCSCFHNDCLVINHKENRLLINSRFSYVLFICW